MSERVVSFRPQSSQYAWTFGGAAPVLRVRAGSVLELWSEDCFAGRVRSQDDLVSVVCQFPFLNPQTGPFYVDGAEPGDTLAVHFISIEPSRDWAASTTVPLFGALTSTHLTATLQDPLPERVWIWELDRAARTCRFQALDGDYAVDLPMDPMHGTVGVAPANLEVLSALTPSAHGGNMDTPEMRAGTTCYLGVNVEGALFSLGDGHARQGEGETCGVAVECAMDTVVASSAVTCPARSTRRPGATSTHAARSRSSGVWWRSLGWSASLIPTTWFSAISSTPTRAPRTLRAQPRSREPWRARVRTIRREPARR